MTFTTVPVQVAGPSYQSRSRPLSSQLTMNMYHQTSALGKDQLVLHSFPGQSLLSAVSGADRGAHIMKEVLFHVVGGILYEINSAYVQTNRGAVSGAGRCIMADDGINLVIVSDIVQVYNSSTQTMTTVTDADIVGAISVAFLNNQFLYTKPDLTTVSTVGDPLTANGLDAVGAESSPDDLVRDFVYDQTIYRFGKRTCELWYNTGVGRPPIDRIEGQAFTVGLAAIHSIANTDNAIYWLGDDRAIYRTVGDAKERISDDGISNHLESFNTIDDAIGYTFTLQGQDFYLITFPTENKTFLVNESLGKNGWVNLSSGVSEDAYSGTSFANAYGKNLVFNNGSLLELKLDEYTQDSDTLIRERILASINSDILGVKGRAIKFSRLELIMEQGIGLITGQGEDPKIIVEYSIDGGRSFASGGFVSVGRAGEHTRSEEHTSELQSR